MAAAKKAVKREMYLSDLDGIKKALLFFIEREKSKELDKGLDRTSRGMYKNHESRLEHRSKIKKEVNKKYEDLIKGLK